MLYFQTNVTQPLFYISCGQFVNTNWMHMKRSIDSFEIIYGLKGCLYIQQDGVLYEVTKGKSLLILPNHTHGGYRISEKEVSFYWMHFKCPEPFRLIDSKIFGQTHNFLQGTLNDTITIPVFFEPHENERLLVLIKQLLHNSVSENAFPIAGSYFITLILMELSLQAAAPSSAVDSCDTTSRRLAAITDWLQLHLDGNYTVEQIADKFNFNKDYLCRVFKKHIGMSIVKYMNKLKTERAKQMLRETDLTVKQVAFELGYSDSKYFMKIFKSYESITPSGYRNSYYRTHLNDK